MQAQRCMAPGGSRLRAGAARCTQGLVGSNQQLSKRVHGPRSRAVNLSGANAQAPMQMACRAASRQHAGARLGVAPHAAPGGALAPTSLASVSMDDELPVKHLQRKQRLTTLLELRRLYQNVLHANWCLQQASPIYQPVEQQLGDRGQEHSASTLSAVHTSRQAGDSAQDAPAHSSHSQQGATGSGSSPNDIATYSAASSSDGTASLEDEKEREKLEQEQRNEALAAVAEMQLTSELLKASLRVLPQGFGWVFGSGEVGSREEERVRSVARECVNQLRERVLQELPLLPFGGEQQAQALVDARVNRFLRRPSAAGSTTESLGSAVLSMDPEAAGSGGSPSPIERLEQAEKVAEAFVQRRIKPALRRAQQAQLGDLLRDSGAYLKGLWVRLNGGGRSGRRSGLEALGLPVPLPTLRDSEVAISSLALQLESLEKQLQDASKARETKLRRAGLSGRVQMAIQMKYGGLDADVLQLSRLLAVRTLQLEMEYVYRSLEDEALDASGYDLGGGVPVDLADRDASLGELALLIADFVLLDEQLCALSAALRGSEAAGSGSEGGHGSGLEGAEPAMGGLQGGSIVGSSSGGAGTVALAGLTGGMTAPVVTSGRVAPSGRRSGAVSQAAEAAAAAAAAAGGGPALGIVGEDILEKLALEIPDFRLRTGVIDEMVFGNQGVSLTKLQLQSQEALGKVREAIDFLVRGVRLLGSDVANSGRLFTRAALGGTLKPREVSALRRTARDLLTFIPFTIILIIPLTPLGHVLVFSLIQTYFPSFFPSCFTKRRQDIMVKYEELQRQLLIAQTQAEQAEEEAELARAAAMVARLTAPDETASPLNSTSSSADEASLVGGAGAAGGAGRAAAGQGGAAAGAAAASSSQRGSGGATGEAPLGAAASGVSGGPGSELLAGGSRRGGPAGAEAGSGAQGAAAGVQGGQAGGNGAAVSSASLPHVAKVKALEQEISQVLESVNMGETLDDEGDFLADLHGSSSSNNKSSSQSQGGSGFDAWQQGR